MKNNLTSIVLLITEFLVIGGIAYGILKFFNIFSLEWIRMLVSVFIALLLGIIIYFKGKNLKVRNN